MLISFCKPWTQPFWNLVSLLLSHSLIDFSSFFEKIVHVVCLSAAEASVRSLLYFTYPERIAIVFTLLLAVFRSAFPHIELFDISKFPNELFFVQWMKSLEVVIGRSVKYPFNEALNSAPPAAAAPFPPRLWLLVLPSHSVCLSACLSVSASASPSYSSTPPTIISLPPSLRSSFPSIRFLSHLQAFD